MSRIVISVALLALGLLSCGETQIQRSIQGNLVGADGEVPPLAHIHLLALGDDIRSRIEYIKVAEGGAFMLVLPDEGYYDLLVTAVNHRALRIPLVSDEGFELRDVLITPVPYRYYDSLERVRIIGDWSGFSWREAEPMVLQDDGTFTYERQVEADTLAYQILDAEVSGRSINGTDSDYYVYDGGGDYLSVVAAEDGTARITFDPEQARIATPGDFPVVDFGDPDHPLAEIWEIRTRWREEMDRSDKAYREYLEKEGASEGFQYDMASIKRYLMDRMSQADNQTTKRYAALTMAAILDLGVPLEDEDLMAITELLPVTDRMWAAQPTAFLEVFEQTYGADKMVDLFEDNLDEVVENKVRAAMLLELGLEAKGVGDTARQREIYDDLVKNRLDINTPYISYRIETQLDPDLKITAGKPVPDFEVELLDDKATVSNRALLGKYYLIDFWATWCRPCLSEMPGLHSVYEEFKDSGFEILSISFDESVRDVKAFRTARWEMPWLHTIEQDMLTSDIGTAFEVSGIPKPVLVDPNGIIIAVGPELRGARLEEVLVKHLGQ